MVRIWNSWNLEAKTSYLFSFTWAGTQGNASGGERAKFTGKVGNVMVDCAWDFINRVNVLQEPRSKGNYVQ
jgi:hypothetical protein